MKAQKLTKETISHIGMTPRKFPDFAVGDTIALSQWITEGEKKRIQVFQGDVIAYHRNGASTTFIVRKIGANSVAVERIYPYYSPIIDSIKIVKRGDVRRAKLFYVRDRVGKKARIKERILTKEEKAQEAAKQEAKFKTQDDAILAAEKKAQEAAAKAVEAEAKKSAKEDAQEAPNDTATKE